MSGSRSEFREKLTACGSRLCSNVGRTWEGWDAAVAERGGAVWDAGAGLGPVRATPEGSMATGRKRDGPCACTGDTSVQGPPLAALLASLNTALDVFERALQAGTRLVFGYLRRRRTSFQRDRPAANFVLAFRALPLVLFVAALSALLFHWGVLPLLVRGFAWPAASARWALAGLSAFPRRQMYIVGMVEAPLVIAPYLPSLSRGELFIVMNCGMATIAGTVLVLYATLLGPVVPNALGHLLMASIIATPVAIAVAALMVPPRLTDDASCPI